MDETEKAVKAKMDGIAFSLPASSNVMRRMMSMTIGDYLDRINKAIQLAKSHNMLARATVKYVMGAPRGENIDAKQVNSIVSSLIDMGVDEISLEDSMAAGDYSKLTELLDTVSVPKEKLAVRFYDTRYTGLEMVVGAMANGISTIDCSLGGLGTNKNLNSVLGPVSAADLLFALDCMNIEHGIRWKKVLRAGDLACEWLGKENLADVFKVDFEECNKYKLKLAEKQLGFRNRISIS